MSKTLAKLAALAAAFMLAAPSMADAQTTIRVQSVIPISADEVVMLKDFAEDVKALTNGEVVIEVLPAGAVVGVAETLDAVDKGLIEGGFAWTHYWSGKHPAAVLFGSPPAGSGSAWTIPPGYRGSSMAAARISMTGFGTRWASM
jgi:TRAP-type mannitol/chloroaromatic compound transport system substrate-binding protein